MARRSTTSSILILYNHVGNDEYETIKKTDPSSLGFTPAYNLKSISTVEEEYIAIAEALNSQGYSSTIYNLREDVRRFSVLLKEQRPDIIFNLVEFFHDSQYLEGAVTGMFDLYQIPYTGSSGFTLGLCLRKGFTKQILQAHGIPTPKFIFLSEPKVPKRHGLKYPLIVKPAREDASSGVNRNSVVYDDRSLKRLLRSVFAEFAPPILLEEYIEGRELHVSILGNDPPEVLPPIEYDFTSLPKDHPNIITYDAKWNPLDESFHQIHAVCPAVLNARLSRKIREISLSAYRTLGCRDYARLDLRIGRDDAVYVLEVNPNPDLTEGVSFMDSAEKAGLSFGATLGKIAGYALQRNVPLQ